MLSPRSSGPPGMAMCTRIIRLCEYGSYRSPICLHVGKQWIESVIISNVLCWWRHPLEQEKGPRHFAGLAKLVGSAVWLLAHRKLLALHADVCSVCRTYIEPYNNYTYVRWISCAYIYIYACYRHIQMYSTRIKNNQIQFRTHTVYSIAGAVFAPHIRVVRYCGSALTNKTYHSIISRTIVQEPFLNITHRCEL